MNTTSVCHRCGSKVVRYEFSTDKVTVASIDELKQLAFWCAKCAGLICTECARINVGEGAFMPYGFCLVCDQRAELATEEQMVAPMSRALKKPAPTRGWLSKAFGQPSPPAGSFAYLFVVTRHQKPQDTQTANQYLYEVAKMCAVDPSTGQSPGKLAAAWETDPVDRGQLIYWASQAFHEDFKAMSTKYDLSFSRFEHPSGNGQVVVARHR